VNGPENRHIVKRYDQELAKLRGLTLEMGELALEQVRAAVEALCREDVELARQVLRRERQVNNADLIADEAAISLLAMRQPLARDLRLVVGLSKTITDIEHIGDEAKKIADATIANLEKDSGRLPGVLVRDARSMSELATLMLDRALEALAENDWAMAVEVVQTAPRLDDELQAGLRRLSTYLVEDPRNVGHVINIVLIIKGLERVGEHAQNIAESVIYYVKGRDVRHVKAEQLSEGFLED
jgi:phosphate transport system protein